MSPMLVQLLGVGLSLGIGALGKAVGNGPMTGPKPWGKVLAPVAAVGAGIVYEKLTGAQLPVSELLGQGSGGVALGGAAIAIQSVVKSAAQLVAEYRKK
jgi:F0F1-type ATP synthase membrane subunit c/vacuolar-type H+-ATPase subunit K